MFNMTISIIAFVLLLLFAVDRGTAEETNGSRTLTCYEFTLTGVCKAFADFDAAYAKYYSTWLGLTVENSAASRWILENHFQSLAPPSLKFELNGIYTEKLVVAALIRLQELRPDLRLTSRSYRKTTDCNSCSHDSDGDPLFCTTLRCVQLWRNEVTINLTEYLQAPYTNFTHCDDEIMRYHWTTQEMRSYWRCSIRSWDSDYCLDDEEVMIIVLGSGAAPQGQRPPICPLLSQS